MSAGEPSGAGRRLTEAEEQAAAVLFADGLSTRAVAAQLGVGNGTAARLKQRLAARSASPGSSDQAEATMTDHDDDHDDDQAAAPGEPLEMTGLQPGQPAGDERLAQLRSDREEIAAEVAKHEDRAAASRSAVAQLEAERIEALAAGRDAQPLRTRRRDAEDDAADSADAAGLARARLARADQEIAVVVARQELAALRGELAAAVAGRDEVMAGTGERQRRAVLAVRLAAEDMVAVFAGERAAVQLVGQLAAAVAGLAAAAGQPGPVVPAAVSTALQVPQGCLVPLPFTQMMWRAQAGNVAQTAISLGENLGWLPPAPPAPEEVAAWQARQAEMAGQRGPRPGQPWTRESPESVGVDAEGNVLRPRRAQPHPSDAYLPHAAGAGIGRPGWLGGQPWPG